MTTTWRRRITSRKKRSRPTTNRRNTNHRTEGRSVARSGVIDRGRSDRCRLVEEVNDHFHRPPSPPAQLRIDRILPGLPTSTGVRPAIPSPPADEPLALKTDALFPTAGQHHYFPPAS